MTIKEIEERTGLDRANIRFYEKEGLLAPARLANGYRDYSEQDADTLLRIKLLRSLHVPLDEIRALQRGDKTLAETMNAHLHTLAQEKQAVTVAEDVCRAMQQDHAQFEDLNAEKYLDQLARGPQTETVRYVLPKDDCAPHPAHPWRRLFARTLDYNLYLLPLELLCLLVFHLNPNSAEGQLASAFCSVFAYLMMLFIEPALLHFFGTTPGKWLFGLHITNEDGARLTYEEGLQRTWGVIRYGYGFCIPFYEIYRQWQCYKLCTADEPCAWDEFPLRRRYTIRDTKPWRGAVWFAVTTALVFVNLWAAEVSALPPNRGNLTVAQFAENYNFLADYYTDTDYVYILYPDGHWSYQSQPSEFTAWLVLSSPPPAIQYFTDEDGILTGFQIEDPKGTFWDLSNSDTFSLTALAMIQASPESRIFMDTAKRTVSRLSNPALDDFSFTEAGITVAYTAELIGDETISYKFTVTKDPQP